MKNRNRYIYCIAAGHLITDMNQGILPAALPFLIAQHNYTYAAAAGLVFGLNLLSSVIQPVFGLLADKFEKPWVMSAGILAAGGGMAATGLLSSWPLLFAAVMLSGAGVAAFHPEAARYANKVSPQGKKGIGLSIFSFGGNLGYAVGPLAATSLILAFGLKGVSLVVIPTLAAALLLLVTMNAFQREHEQERAAHPVPETAPEKDRWGAFTLLCILLFSRSFVFFGLNTFLPLYWIKVFHQTEAAGAAALSLMLAAGAMSTLLGGKLADRFGFRTVGRVGFPCLFPLLCLFAWADEPALATLLLVPVAAALYLPFSPMVVLGQKYLPNRVGLASGVTLGLVISIGGLAAPILGKIADLHGLETIMHVLTALAVIPGVMAFTLPKTAE